MSKGAERSPATAEPYTEKTWFARNWKWLLPFIMGVPILLIAVFASRMIGSFSDEVTSTLTSSEPYQHAVEAASKNEQVLQLLGAPVQASGNFNGAMSVSESVKGSGKDSASDPSTSSGEADLTIPLKGTMRKGSVHVVARKSAGKWRYQTLEVTVEGSPKAIDLLGSWDQPEGK